MKGKATHPQRLDPPLDCQDVSRYQAKDPTYFGEKNPPAPWSVALVAIPIFLWVAALLWMGWKLVSLLTGSK